MLVLFLLRNQFGYLKFFYILSYDTVEVSWRYHSIHTFIYICIYMHAYISKGQYACIHNIVYLKYSIYLLCMCVKYFRCFRVKQTNERTYPKVVINSPRVQGPEAINSKNDNYNINTFGQSVRLESDCFTKPLCYFSIQ